MNAGSNKRVIIYDSENSFLAADIGQIGLVGNAIVSREPKAI
jgi:hypothetical protein